MASAANLTASASAYVKISPSGIIAILLAYGTSTITQGYEQDLTLEPGRYSVDLDGNIFNGSVSEELQAGRVPLHLFSPRQDWNYEYYCRIYGVSNFPNVSGSLLPIDDARVDPLNPSCLTNQSSEKDLFLQPSHTACC